MPTFNIHHGQMRYRPISGPQDNRRAMQHVAKRPMGRIQMGGLKDGPTLEYKADVLGNIVVDAPKHVNAMRELGWPIYTGDGRRPVAWDDLVWPNPERPDSEYERAIMDSLKARLEV